MKKCKAAVSPFSLPAPVAHPPGLEGLEGFCRVWRGEVVEKSCESSHAGGHREGASRAEPRCGFDPAGKWGFLNVQKLFPLQPKPLCFPRSRLMPLSPPLPPRTPRCRSPSQSDEDSGCYCCITWGCCLSSLSLRSSSSASCPPSSTGTHRVPISLHPPQASSCFCPQKNTSLFQTLFFRVPSSQAPLRITPGCLEDSGSHLAFMNSKGTITP